MPCSQRSRQLRPRPRTAPAPVGRGGPSGRGFGPRLTPYARFVLPTVSVLAQDGTTLPPTTLIGPTGTAPGLNFVQPAERPLDDSSNTTTFGWPMGIAMVFLLAVVVVIALRARRTGRAGTSGR
jgi:hypothetical protein